MIDMAVLCREHASRLLRGMMMGVLMLHNKTARHLKAPAILLSNSSSQGISFYLQIEVTISTDDWDLEVIEEKQSVSWPVKVKFPVRCGSKQGREDIITLSKAISTITLDFFKQTHYFAWVLERERESLSVFISDAKEERTRVIELKETR